MKVYKPKIVQQIIDYYGASIHHSAFPTIQEHLSTLATMLHEGIQTGHDCLYSEINNYHPLHLGEPIIQLKEADLDLTDCKWTIACEYGYKSWEDVLDLRKTEYNRPFEEAVDYLLGGHFQELQELIKTYPSIITASSQYGHKATILHYTASNGVELWRQQVPINLPEMTAYLIHKGVSKWTLMNAYGSQYDTITLLKSSIHPYNAGVGQEMEALLS